MNKIIEHDGIIKRIERDFMIVSILNKAACVSCQLKGACTLSEIEEKEIEVATNPGQNFVGGEKVKVYYQQELGFLALFLGYIFPFLIMFFILIIGQKLKYSELIYGLAAIFSLLPYYLLLFLFKNKIKNTFRFSVKKTELLRDLPKINLINN